VANVEPFQRANTIAKLSMEIWRENFLEPNQIVNLEGPLNIRQQQSVGALRFFKLFSAITGKRIRTAEWMIGEFRVPDSGYRVDGILGDETAIEYLGCFFHGNSLKILDNLILYKCIKFKNNKHFSLPRLSTMLSQPADGVGCRQNGGGIVHGNATSKAGIGGPGADCP
jgi:hypothetical protein